MTEIRADTGLAALNAAQIYYEIAGDGQPFVMIHAGVADSRQWNNEFVGFAPDYRVLRYDMRGYGKSEPVEGEFSHMRDLIALLEHLDLAQPLILMGCSMGGALAMDFALARPGTVRALIMVGSGPSGLALDVPAPPKLEAVIKADEAGDIDLLAELETQLWFDGTGRSPEQVNQTMRALAHKMNRHVVAQEAMHLGKRVPDAEIPAAGRLAELRMPVLVIVGSHDTPYVHAAADTMAEQIPSARKAVIEDAAHLANMDQPGEFRRIVTDFLGSLPG